LPVLRWHLRPVLLAGAIVFGLVVIALWTLLAYWAARRVASGVAACV
jgi:hypothetical protein